MYFPNGPFFLRFANVPPLPPSGSMNLRGLDTSDSLPCLLRPSLAVGSDLFFLLFFFRRRPSLSPPERLVLSKLVNFFPRPVPLLSVRFASRSTTVSRTGTLHPLMDVLERPAGKGSQLPSFLFFPPSQR